ncbi:YlbF family regulator [Tepidibacillus sp. LV47]|uniref:YlbF family regulator n=1 Tax=Tepidibacillus sp. LV47 TaxID=3398228 RepID=UPI003AACB519
MLPIKKEDILKQTQKLAKMISEQEEIKIYQVAENKIKSHKRIQELITEIKLKQQELVNAKHFRKPNYIHQLEETLDHLNAELNSIPLVHQYQQYQQEINHYLQSMIQLIKNELSKTLPLDHDNLSKNYRFTL